MPSLFRKQVQENLHVSAVRTCVSETTVPVEVRSGAGQEACGQWDTMENSQRREEKTRKDRNENTFVKESVLKEKRFYRNDM